MAANAAEAATDGLLWPEQVAEALGVKPRSVTVYLSNRQRHVREHESTEWDIPAPCEIKRREVMTEGGHKRTVNSPRWRASDIEAFRARREGPRPQAARVRDASGQYAKVTS